MKNFLNIIGYISCLSVPILLLDFLDYVGILKIFILIALLIIVSFEVLHYRKTKIKYTGIRILIAIVGIVVSTLIISSGYGMIKNIQANKLADKIDRIEFTWGDQIITSKELKNKLYFVPKMFLSKGTTKIIIYYKDGTKEDSEFYYPSTIKIKNNYYNYGYSKIK